MKRVFTEFVRALATPSRTIDEDSYRELWLALRRVLRSELQHRGLWYAPPSYLGVYGWESWTEVDKEAGAREDALEELTFECYTFVFVHRLSSLVAQLEVKHNIDGLVFLSIRHFIHDRQKAHDPLGYRTFEILHAAVTAAVATGILRVLEGEPRIRNSTVLGTGAPGSAPRRLEPAQELRPLVYRWNSELIPELVLARGAARDAVVDRLRQLLAELCDEGISTFRFRDLIDVMKSDVRVRWAALLDQQMGDKAKEEGGGGPMAVRLVPPATAVEEKDSFHKLAFCVQAHLDRRRHTGPGGTYLRTLWSFLHAYACDPPAGACNSSAGTPDPRTLELPSQRKLAKLLRIPRNRLSGLLRELASTIEHCRECGLITAACRRRPPLLAADKELRPREG